ncbi:MAG: 23S rRNA (pseudouridine(1915)-N(3))-methyltransferase RlmH [Hyphomicrobium sp.]
MRILIAVVGKLKDAEERAIVARYSKRFDQTGRSLGLGPVEIAELIESRAPTPAARRNDEAQRLLKLGAHADIRIVLDVEGQGLSSEAFARLLAKHRDGGAKSAAILVGGPDGHGEEAMAAAHIKLSLGSMTLPHGLARVVLVEQLYRAATILAGHPYHRG